MKALRIGLVGTGGMGKVHYANWKEVAGAEIVALCSRSARPEQWDGLPVYPTLQEMAEKEQLDAVDICLPTCLHHDTAVAALKLGLHVICEKPIALSRAQAEDMLDTARETGKHLYIAQVLQFTKEIQALHGLVESGEYGRVLDASFLRLSACPGWSDGGWLFDREKSGLLPYDLHIHDLDVMVSLFGKPNGFTVHTGRGGDRPYAELLRVDYDYGSFHVNAEAAWYHASSPWTARWQVVFENAVVIHDGSTMTAYPYGAAPRIFDIKDEVEISTGVNVPPCGWYYNELDHFARCIREGVPSPLVPGEQLLNVMEILEEVSQWT